MGGAAVTPFTDSGQLDKPGPLTTMLRQQRGGVGEREPPKSVATEMGSLRGSLESLIAICCKSAHFPVPRGLQASFFSAGERGCFAGDVKFLLTDRYSAGRLNNFLSEYKERLVTQSPAVDTFHATSVRSETASLQNEALIHLSIRCDSFLYRGKGSTDASVQSCRFL